MREAVGLEGRATRQKTSRLSTVPPGSGETSQGLAVEQFFILRERRERTDPHRSGRLKATKDEEKKVSPFAKCKTAKGRPPKTS